MARITLLEDRFATEATEQEYGGLESGDILYFPVSPPLVSEEERAFLVQRRQSGVSYHKNISYRPNTDQLRGAADSGHDLQARFHSIMRSYSRRAVAFMTSFLRHYATGWKIDFASFRPIQEEGRKVSLHSRNDLLHVDNFPTRPSHGDRLLRIFTNIHPDQPRVWVTSDPFEQLVGRFANRVGVARRPGRMDVWKRSAVRVASRLGLPVVDRPPYDAFMLRIHHAMKEDAEFQNGCRKDRWEFPAGSTWIVFTDSASHACLRGQYLLEQTFLVGRTSLVFPEKAPIAILERMAGYPLARRSA